MNHAINELIVYLKNEKGLSNNTLESYGRDLKQFGKFLKEKEYLTFNDVNKTTIITYLLYLQKKGRATSTISRNLASMRSLYQYLLSNRVIDSDPTVSLESPRPERKLPSVLSLNEIEKLINQPDNNSCMGSRDKAMIELLYATGIRVTELVCLDVEDLNIEMGYVRCKGSNSSKERIIPIGSMAKEALNTYANKYRPELIKKGEEALFANYYGKRLTRQGFWKIIKRHTKNAEISKKNYASYTETFLRYSFNSKWSRLKVSSGNARSLRHFYYPDIHANKQE